MGVGSRCVGFAPNFGGGATEKNKFSKRTTFKIVGVPNTQRDGSTALGDLRSFTHSLM